MSEDQAVAEANHHQAPETHRTPEVGVMSNGLVVPFGVEFLAPVPQGSAAATATATVPSDQDKD